MNGFVRICSRVCSLRVKYINYLLAWHWIMVAVVEVVAVAVVVVVVIIMCILCSRHQFSLVDEVRTKMDYICRVPSDSHIIYRRGSETVVVCLSQGG